MRWVKKLEMKKIIIILKVWLTNWGNYLGLSLLLYLLFYSVVFFMVINDTSRTVEETFQQLTSQASLQDILVTFLFPLLWHIPFTFGYLFFQFLIDSILLFVFKFSIRKTIKIENYIFILTFVVVLFFTLLIEYSEKKIDLYELIKFSLIGVLILILSSRVYIYTQKQRTKKLEKILEIKPVHKQL